MKSYQKLGFSTYADYIASPHWQGFRRRYEDAGLPMNCMACNGPDIHLHHHTYERFGEEDLGDVVPLCGACHGLVHEILKRNGWDVEKTFEAIEQLNKQWAGTPRFKGKRAKPSRVAKIAGKCRRCGLEQKRIKERKRTCVACGGILDPVPCPKQ